MALLLNILWFVLGGLMMSLGWWLAGQRHNSQIQLLVSAKPREATFYWYSFSFKTSVRHGQKTSWGVER